MISINNRPFSRPLLTREVQEQRRRFFQVMLQTLLLAASGLLAGITLTAVIAACLWRYSPFVVLLSLIGIFGVYGVWLCRQLAGLMFEWQALSESICRRQKEGSSFGNLLE